LRLSWLPQRIRKKQLIQMINIDRRNPVSYLAEYFNGLKLSDEIRIIAKVAAVRYVEQARFSLSLIRNNEQSTPAFSGLYSAGRISQITGWIDGDYYSEVSFPKSFSFSLSGSFDVTLFKILGALIPNGGSLMVSYSLFANESVIHKETKLSLDRGYPPVVSPLGYLLFTAGCGFSFKDWYYAEGGREGPEKLQGYKPANPKVERQQSKRILLSLQSFMQIKDTDALARSCKSRANLIIHSLAFPP
jgi:hypothetical protein